MQTKEECDAMRERFMAAATATHGRIAVKQFLKACDKQFGTSAVVDYSRNFVVTLQSGERHMFSGMIGRFYQIET
jgi:hypothetical protein